MHVIDAWVLEFSFIINIFPKLRFQPFSHFIYWTSSPLYSGIHKFIRKQIRYWAPMLQIWHAWGKRILVHVYINDLFIKYYNHITWGFRQTFSKLSFAHFATHGQFHSLFKNEILQFNWLLQKTCYGLRPFQPINEWSFQLSISFPIVTNLIGQWISNNI